ncbi:MAG: hypothetical protein KBD62_35105 [Kofleriaceae bacterium]|nr:hypothetical protein [Kofleriaceae bacterium]
MRLGLALALGASFVRGGGPAPDPDLTVPDAANNRAYFSPAGPFWQDVARTVPATTTGDPVKAWDDLSGLGQHLIWQSGPVSTLAAGGGIDCPAGSIMTCAATTSGTSWSFYIWSDAPAISALNFMIGEAGVPGIAIAPMHLTNRTYFGTNGSNYQYIDNDTGDEKLRGMAITGATAECFVGGSQSQLILNAITVAGFTTNDDPTYQAAHTIRFIVLRDVADTLEGTNAYRRHVSRTLNPINPADDVIRVVVGVHYEGLTPPAVGSPYNNAQVLARARLPFAKFTHLFSANYEVLGTSHATVAAGFAPLFHASRDEFGMHIHWLFELATALGITIELYPTIGGATAPDGLGGYNTFATAYNLAAHRAFVEYSADILETYGYGRPKTFVTGNWLTTDALLQALVEDGFTHDVSAFPTTLTTVPPFTTYSQGELTTRFAGATETSQPFDRSISGFGSTIRQITANCGMTSYDAAADMLARLIAIPAGQVGMVSTHENDIAGWTQIATALEDFETHCAANGKRVVYITANAA